MNANSATDLPPFPQVVPPADTRTGVDPAGYGRLAEVADWLSARLPHQGRLRRPVAVLLRGDHDGPDDGRSDPEFLGDQLATVCRRSDITLVERDVATRYAIDHDLVVRRGHPDGRGADVASRAEILAAIAAGRRLADQQVDAGADLVIAGLAGRGHLVPLSCLSALLCGLEPADAVELSRVPLSTWIDAVGAVRDILFRLRNTPQDALSLLAAVGGTDLATLAGLVAHCACRRTVVLVDGLPGTLAAVLAHRLAPGAESWLLAAGPAPDRPGRRLQELIGLPTITDLGTFAPSGVGAALLVPLLAAAVAAPRSAGGLDQANPGLELAGDGSSERRGELGDGDDHAVGVHVDPGADHQASGAQRG